MLIRYQVLQEIGHGTHGRVRLGRDMSSETEPLPSMEEGEEEVVPDNGNGTYYVGHFSFYRPEGNDTDELEPRRVVADNLGDQDCRQKP